MRLNVKPLAMVLCDRKRFLTPFSAPGVIMLYCKIVRYVVFVALLRLIRLMRSSG